jgi:hypothetical protein
MKLKLMFFLSHRKFGQVPSLPYSYQNYLCLNKEEYRLSSFHPRHPRNAENIIYEATLIATPD